MNTITELTKSKAYLDKIESVKKNILNSYKDRMSSEMMLLVVITKDLNVLKKIEEVYKDTTVTL